MQIIFEADLNKMTEELQELSPERFLRILAVAVKNMAKRNAHEAGKGGKSFWQREILRRQRRSKKKGCAAPRGIGRLIFFHFFCHPYVFRACAVARTGVYYL